MDSFSTPPAVPSLSVGSDSSSKIFPSSIEWIIMAELDGEQPMTFIFGHTDLKKDAVPAINPPPPMDIIIASNSLA